MEISSPGGHSKIKRDIELYLFNHVGKSHLENAWGVDTSQFAIKIWLS